VRDGKALQIGPSTISAEVANTAISGEARVGNAGYDAGRASLQASYRMYYGQALTFVQASLTGAVAPVATGFRHHPGLTLLQGDPRGGWSYFASWGRQDLTGDDLGLALFYRPVAVAGDVRDDGQSWFVAFKDPASVDYAFGATWVQDGSGVRDAQGFQAWLDATVDGLNHPVVVKVLPGRR